MSGVLKAQLFELERHAATLEKIVYKELIALESLPVHELEPAESKVLRKLHKLDDIQDEIDMLTAKLKALGAWEPVSYSECKYEYRRPKYVKPLPQKEAKAKARAERRKAKAKEKVYPVRSPRDPKPYKRKTDREVMEAKQAREAAREAKAAAAEAAKAERARLREEARIARQAAIAAKPKAKIGRPRKYPLVAPKPKAVKPPKPKPEPKPKNVRPPKAKPAPKPRKPRESRELKLAKKRRDSVTERLYRLDAQIDAERLDLERRLEERKARVLEVANQSTADKGPQNRRNAALALANVEGQLRDLPKRKEERLNNLTEQLEKALIDIEMLIESASQ
jgi:hypothetical protein